jgi:hypothetical protein
MGASLIGGGANGSIDTTVASQGGEPSFFGKKSKFGNKLD